MRLILGITLALALALGCSDDDSTNNTKKDTGGGTADQGVQQDGGGTADQKVTTDQAATPDQAAANDAAKTAKVLTKTHTGWQKVTCQTSSCHKSLPTSHTVKDPWACGKCHGGNGACSAPAGHMTAGCLGCHTGSKAPPSSHSAFTASSMCAGCHMASAGTVKCN